MIELTVEKIDEKLAKGEKLTKEESQFIMSLPPENASDTNKPTVEVEEEIEWPVEADDKKVDEKTNDKDKEKVEDKKPELKPEEKKPVVEDTKLDIERLEVELAKPEGKESLDGLTKREVAYFWSMRRDRRARQRAEEERDAARFSVAKLKKEKEEPEVKKEPEEDPLKDLKAKDPEDFMTVAEAVKVLEKALKKPPAPKEEAPKQRVLDPVHQKYLQFCENECKANHSDDYDAVMELAPEIINSNEKYVLEVGQAIQSGENPAEKVYQLIKQDAEFDKLFPAAEIKVKARKTVEKKPDKTPEELEKEKKAQAAEAALEKNKDKTKTTGHAGGEGGAAEDSDKVDGYSINDITNMSDLQFAKLPKKTREKFLQLYG